MTQKRIRILVTANASPNPMTNAEFMQSLRLKYRRPFGLPLPKWALEIGAFMLGTETELILKSRWVIPERLLANGYTFKWPFWGQN